MSRSNYKKPVLTFDELFYFYSIVDNGYKFKLPSYRNKTINGLNISYKFYIHQGNSHRDIKLSEYSIGKKLGAFSKTRKPFFFRSKKKR
jgi:ribosomal protein S19